MLDLVTLFDSLQLPNAITGHEVRFSAQPIPGYERHRLAKDADNTPSFLISVTETLEGKRPIPIKLEHLTVQYDVDCRISQSDDSIEEDRFTIVRCIGADKAIHIYFLHCIGAILALLGTMPSRLDIAYAIKNLTTLFRSMTEKPRKSVQGLWAELFLIAQAHDAATMIAAWHMTPEDRYDFNSGNQRIEVKSTASRRRQHFFSLEQLSPPSGTTLFIASLFMEYAGAGSSVMELAERIRERVNGNPELLLHMDQIISSMLGENWRDALEVRFDLELAEDSLAFFGASTIPTVDRNLPSGVSEVKFKSDLINCLPTPIQSLRALGGLLQAASGRKFLLSAKSKRRNSHAQI